MLQFRIDEEQCIACGECALDCPAQIIEMGPKTPFIPKDKEESCYRCQHCLAICPTAALSIWGKDPKDSIPLKGHLPRPEQVEALIMGRRTKRRFLKEPLDKGLIQHLLDVTAHAPTGMNSQQVLLTVIDDPKVMDRFRQTTYQELKKVVEAKKLPESMDFFAEYVPAFEAGNDIMFRGAPHMLVTSSPQNAPSGETDSIIALTYFELLAQAQGLGTVWSGLVKWASALILPDIQARLGIPSDHRIGYFMVFGKPAMIYHRTVQRGPVKVNRVNSM